MTNATLTAETFAVLLQVGGSVHDRTALVDGLAVRVWFDDAGGVYGWKWTIAGEGPDVWYAQPTLIFAYLAGHWDAIAAEQRERSWSPDAASLTLDQRAVLARAGVEVTFGRERWEVEFAGEGWLAGPFDDEDEAVTYALREAQERLRKATPAVEADLRAKLRAAEARIDALLNQVAEQQRKADAVYRIRQVDATRLIEERRALTAERNDARSERDLWRQRATDLQAKLDQGAVDQGQLQVQRDALRARLDWAEKSLGEFWTALRQG